MSERLPCLAGAVSVTAWVVLATAPAAAVPHPLPVPGPSASPTAARSALPVAQLLMALQQRCRAVESATDAYHATTQRLAQQRAEVDRLDGRLTRIRLDLRSSRVEAGRLARQQYQAGTSLSPYVRLLFARDPQHALDEGHLIGRLARERAATVHHLASAEKSADALARAARKALDGRLALTDQQQRARDDVEQRLTDVEKLLASLAPEQLAALARFERDTAAAARQTPVAARPSPEATHLAVRLGAGKVSEAPRPGARAEVSPTAAHPGRGAVRPRARGQAPVTDAR